MLSTNSQESSIQLSWPRVTVKETTELKLDGKSMIDQQYMAATGENWGRRHET